MGAKPRIRPMDLSALESFLEPPSTSRAVDVYEYLFGLGAKPLDSGHRDYQPPDDEGELK